MNWLKIPSNRDLSNHSEFTFTYTGNLHALILVNYTNVQDKVRKIKFKTSHCFYILSRLLKNKEDKLSLIIPQHYHSVYNEMRLIYFMVIILAALLLP